MSQDITLLDSRLVQSTLIACGTLLVYDFLCTLDQEIAYVWGSWSIGSVLFIFNRYLPFIDTFLAINLQFSVNTPERCLEHFTVVTWFIVSGILISEFILVMRTYAIWERSWTILTILCISSILTFIPAIIITNVEVLDASTTPNPGCRLSYASPLIIIAYILLMLSETTMAVLTGVKAWRDLRHSRSPWVKQLYKEGLLFYVYLLIISLANVLVPILAPSIFANWLATPQRVFHSVLCSRVLFLILRQRSCSNLTMRVPRARNGNTQSNTVIFTSFFEDASTNLTFRGAETSTTCVRP